MGSGGGAGGGLGWGGGGGDDDSDVAASLISNVVEVFLCLIGKIKKPRAQ